MIKEVPDPTFQCEGCVYEGKFECLQHACCADPNHPIKYFEVTEYLIALSLTTGREYKKN